MARTLNGWRVEALQQALDPHQTTRDWVPPKFSCGTDPVAAYRQQCGVLGVRANANVAALLAEDLRHIDMSRSFLGVLGLLPLLAVVPLLRSLEALNLSSCQMDSQHVTILARIMAQHPSLRSVDLSHNPFSSLGAQALLEAVHANTRITTLVLTGVQIVPVLKKKLHNQLALNTSAAELQDEEDEEGSSDA